MRFNKKLLAITFAFNLFILQTVRAEFVINNTGDEVTDSKTGLIWKRCSEGQTWTGTTCSGILLTFTHEQALARATLQSGVTGWRLPNVKELFSIVDRTRSNPAIDTTIFPATNTNHNLWSSTPLVSSSLVAARYVSFVEGHVSDQQRSVGFNVRLVR